MQYTLCLCHLSQRWGASCEINMRALLTKSQLNSFALHFYGLHSFIISSSSSPSPISPSFFHSFLAFFPALTSTPLLLPFFFFFFFCLLQTQGRSKAGTIRKRKILYIAVRLIGCLSPLVSPTNCTLRYHHHSSGIIIFIALMGQMSYR